MESEEQETQLDPKHRTPALANLIAGYALALGFGILLAMGMGEQATDEIVDEEVVTEGETMAGLRTLPQTKARSFLSSVEAASHGSLVSNGKSPATPRILMERTSLPSLRLLVSWT